MTLEQASDAGFDAFEKVADFAKSSKGYAVQAKFGHVTIVVDRATRELIGAAMATVRTPPPRSTSAWSRSRPV